ncbi:hypothetical protein BDW66DRAFT_93908 [Aspergillus desertorum]
MYSERRSQTLYPYCGINTAAYSAITRHGQAGPRRGCPICVSSTAWVTDLACYARGTEQRSSPSPCRTPHRHKDAFNDSVRESRSATDGPLSSFRSSICVCDDRCDCIGHGSGSSGTVALVIRKRNVQVDYFISSVSIGSGACRLRLSPVKLELELEPGFGVHVKNQAIGTKDKPQV